MTALSLPDDGWREYAIGLGWATDDLDWIEQLACVGPYVDEIMTVTERAITLRGHYGALWTAEPGFAAESIERAIASARTVGTIFASSEKPTESWCPAHGAECRPENGRCGRLSSFWYYPGNMICHQPDVVAVGRRAEIRHCGTCQACIAFNAQSRVLSTPPPPLETPSAALPLKPSSNALLAPDPSLKKPRHGKYAALQMGLLDKK